MSQQKIAVITDSTSDLSPEQLSEWGIYLLPLKVVYRDREYADRIEIQPEQVYADLDRECPGTSTPSPGEALALLEKLRDRGYTHAVSIHISGGLSSTVEVVRMVGRQMKSITVEAVDSKGLSMALGFQAIEAARAVREGCSFQDVVRRVYAVRERMKVFFVVNTLEYLRRGGRIGYVSATLGEILNVKPVIAINEEGKYFTLAKVRGRKKSLARLAELVLEYGRGRKINLAVMHGGAEEECRRLMDDITGMRELDIKETAFGQLGPVMVVHTGPGLVGVVVYAVGDD